MAAFLILQFAGAATATCIRTCMHICMDAFGHLGTLSERASLAIRPKKQRTSLEELGIADWEEDEESELVGRQ